MAALLNPVLKRHIELIEEAGYGPDKLQSLHSSGLFTELLRCPDPHGVDRGAFRKALGFLPFVRDMNREGWKLLDDVEPALKSPEDIGRLELVEFLEPSEELVGAEEIRSRAIKLSAAYGQRDAEFLLEHQVSIPDNFRRFYLTFPGTIWRDRDGYRHVPYLRWDGDRWFLGFRWREDAWDRRGRLVRLKAA